MYGEYDLGDSISTGRRRLKDLTREDRRLTVSDSNPSVMVTGQSRDEQLTDRIVAAYERAARGGRVPDCGRSTNPPGRYHRDRGPASGARDAQKARLLTRRTA